MTPERRAMPTWASAMKLADKLADELCRLADDEEAHNDHFTEHGGAQLLVGLLHLGPTSKAAASATRTMIKLSSASDDYDRVLGEAGGIA